MSETLRYWADLGDNRIGPLLRELVEAIEQEESDEQLRRVEMRLRFMSSALGSYRQRRKQNGAR